MNLEDLAAAAPDGQVPNASLPSGWAPSVTYDPSGRAEVVTLGAGQPGDESTWTDEVRALGVDIPPGWSARLVQVSHDPKAWVRHAQGDDAVTEPVTRRKYVVEPTRSATLNVEELVAAIGKKRPKPVQTRDAQPWAYVHTIADWQIGKPYARVQDPDKRARLRQVRIEAIARIGAQIAPTKASLLLVAGDLFDSPTPSSSDVSAVCQAIGKLELPVLVIPGNHDHGAPGSVWHSPFFQTEQRRRAPNLQVLLERKSLVLDEAIVLPCPLLRRSDSHDPTAWVRQLDWSALPDDRPRLLLAHGSVHGFGATDLDTNHDADEENPASATNRLQLDGPLLEQLDYVALGDWHGLKQVNSRSWYCGTPEPDRFPRTNDYRGGQVLAVTAQRGQLPVVQPRPTASLRWLPITVELQSSADVERLERQLEQLLGDEPGQQLARRAAGRGVGERKHRQPLLARQGLAGVGHRLPAPPHKRGVAAGFIQRAAHPV